MTAIRTIGAYEAKTTLPALLRFVSEGGEVVITRHDRPVAKIIPASPAATNAGLFRQIDAFRASLGQHRGASNRELIRAGRRI